MKLVIGTILAATIAVSAAMPSRADAVADGGAIAWTAPPAAFVTSLYVGVLGRAPESPEVVAAWAANVTGDPRSRLRVFHGFVGSPEYRGKFGDTRGRYHLFANNCPRSPTNRFAIAVQPPSGSWSAQVNLVSYGYARALMGYYLAFTPYRRC